MSTALDRDSVARLLPPPLTFLIKAALQFETAGTVWIRRVGKEELPSEMRFQHSFHSKIPLFGRPLP